MTSIHSRIDDDAPAAAPEPGLLAFAALMLRHFRLIVLTTLAVTALAVLAAFLLPRTWTSRVVLVPSAAGGGDSRMQMLAAQFGMGGLAGRMGGGNAGQSVAAIVKSKALRDSVSQYVRSTRQVNMSQRDLDRLLKRNTSVGT
ncbi:MAG TPA: Wzz/FepE/Etk N-terminal domain-containing protein, partial [Longimicrobium sp.]|nr:Wzz/FepE/Etk N-terminal domain-containing protein [Longimicrobium sp.]